MRKKIAIYFSFLGKWAYPLSQKEYKISYMDFCSLAERNSIDIFFFRGENTYRGNMIFQRGWKFISHTLRRWNMPVHINCIYYKGEHLDLINKIGSDATIVNCYELEKLCTDKYETTRKFPTLSPATMLVQSKRELLEAIQQMPTDRIVIKPLTGYEGRDIVVSLRENLRKRPSSVCFPAVVQEFIETAGGIPGLVTSRHDFRVVIMNGEIVDTYIRVPQKNPYLSNIAQGGKLLFCHNQNIPQDIKWAVSMIDASLSSFYPRIYTADFGWGTKKLVLFELNARPGLPFPGEPSYYRFHQKLLDTLLSGIP